jgi:hypothetical protein
VVEIGHDAFNGATGLTSLSIPDSVTSIGQFAFAGCIGLTSVHMGIGLTYVGLGAFSGCTGLFCDPASEFEHLSPALQGFVEERTCEKLTKCGATYGGTYMSNPPTATSDRECEQVTECGEASGATFETAAPTPTSNRVCTLLTVCDPATEYQITAPTTTTDRVCNALAPACDADTHYESSAPVTSVDIGFHLSSLFYDGGFVAGSFLWFWAVISNADVSGGILLVGVVPVLASLNNLNTTVLQWEEHDRVYAPLRFLGVCNCVLCAHGMSCTSTHNARGCYQIWHMIRHSIPSSGSVQ